MHSFKQLVQNKMFFALPNEVNIFRRIFRASTVTAFVRYGY